jgi:tetratricopeptide (TPR) repeat protein
METFNQSDSALSASIQDLEKEAQRLLSEGNCEEAYRAFKKAAQKYNRKGNYAQATYCFASAASSWNRKAGERLFYNAAKAYEDAALLAQKMKDYEYASLMYKYAALNYERDGEFFSYSYCFYKSKQAYRRFLTLSLIFPARVISLFKPKQSKSFKYRVKDFLSWLVLSFSAVSWGHGEKPSRTLAMGTGVVLLSAFFYSQGVLSADGLRFSPNYFQALYFSAMTFTTVGYGDFIPIGLNQLVASTEALIGLFIMPLFVVGLSRKYLRV